MTDEGAPPAAADVSVDRGRDLGVAQVEARIRDLRVVGLDGAVQLADGRLMSDPEGTSVWGEHILHHFNRLVIEAITGT